MVSEITTNILGAGIMVAALYYNWQILRHFRDHRQVSLAYIFLNDRILDVFRILVISVAIYTTGAMLAAVDATTASVIPSNIDQLLKRAGLAGFALALHHLAQITEKHETADGG